MVRKSTDRATLGRLRALADRPEEQLTYAVQIIEREADLDLLRGALTVVAARADPALRPLLLRAYTDREVTPMRRDPSGFVRAAIVRALRPVARAEDLPLLSRACATYEVRGMYELCSELRAAALITMNEIDDDLAGYQAARLLFDGHTSPLSGEPALTAARLLAAQGQTLPLYVYVTSEQGMGEIVAECLRQLVDLPASLLSPLIEQYRASDRDVVLLGLFDLLLTHPAHDELTDIILDILRATPLLDLYHSVVIQIAAGRHEALIAGLRALAQTERHPDKAAALQEALALV